MARWLTASCLILSLVALGANAFAGANFAHKLAVHVKAHPTSCTKGYPTFTDCTQIISTWPELGDVNVMPVFYDLVGYSLNETGLTWPEASWGSGSWVRCMGDVAIGTISHSVDAGFPSDVSGTSITWSTCQTSVGSAPGYCRLTAFDPGMVCPEPNPATGDYGVADCSPEPGPYYDRPIHVHCAGVGGMIGDDPCRPVSREPRTWGEIKSIFK
jgi:hypothetical protein